jgi:hypothetical protein
VAGGDMPCIHIPNHTPSCEYNCGLDHAMCVGTMIAVRTHPEAQVCKVQPHLSAQNLSRPQLPGT